MKIELKDEAPDSEWVEAGSWFKAFVNLGVRLAEATTSPNFHIGKILLAAPKREFVSAALAFGYSIEKFRAGHTLLKEIELSSVFGLEPGQILRIERKPGPGSADLHVQDVALDSIATPVSPDATSIRINIRAKGSQTPLMVLEQSRLASIAVLPKGFPTGLHKLTAPPKGVQAKTFPPIRWNWQASPGLVIYGEVEYFQEQAATAVRYSPLQTVLGKTELNLEEMGRIDYAENKSWISYVL